MFKISSNGAIYMSRGDNIECPLFINRGTGLEPIRFNLELHPSSQIYFGLTLPNQKFEDAILKQKYNVENINSKGDIIIKLSPEDTLYLDPGKYFYEIKIVLPNNEVNTIIPKTEFWIY